MDALFVVVVLFLALQSAVLALNIVFFPVLRQRRTTSAAAANRPRVSLLIPARNEALVLPETLPGMLAQGADEVIVLDDQSDDGTAELLAAAAGLRVVRGVPLPPGWSGNNWACHQLAQAARGEVLVFTDADVRWSAGALDAVVAEMQATRAGLLSVWPRQLCLTFGERLIVPLVDLLLLANLPHPLVRLLPFASLSGANGQLMAWTRDAYQRTGGHAERPLEVLEDVRMAQRAKALGVPITLRLGGELVQTRMYRSFSEVVAGFGKNIRAAAGGSHLVMLMIWLLNLLAYTAPWLLAPFEGRWWVVALAGVMLRALSNRKVGRPTLEALLQPLGPLALTAVVVRALRFGSGYAWKGRVYR
jgi:glycosyltransferase involved in cell wall biosynthesis